MNVKDIAIKKIVVRERFSNPDRDDIRLLAESMKDVGLLEPIGLNKDYSLIFGLTRLEAARELGWKTIPAVMLDVDVINAQFMELTENMKRRELTAFARGEALEKAKELYLEMHPETGRGGDHKSNRQMEGLEKTPCFSTKISEETGKNVQEIERDIAAVQDISDAARKLVPDSPIEDNRSELKRLGKLDPKDQVKVARAIKKGKAKTVKEAAEIIIGDPFADLPEKEEPILDAKKKPVPDKFGLREIFELRPRFLALTKKIAECRNEWIELAQSAAGFYCENSVKVDLGNAHRAVKFATPHVPCNCQGHGCNRCKKSNYINAAVYEIKSA